MSRREKASTYSCLAIFHRLVPTNARTAWRVHTRRDSEYVIHRQLVVICSKLAWRRSSRAILPLGLPSLTATAGFKIEQENLLQKRTTFPYFSLFLKLDESGSLYFALSYCS